MRNVKYQKIWVAVRVERGFITEIRAYHNEQSARHREYLWRREMNPDYDETAVSDVLLKPQRKRIL
jgi:hypothetical protein